MSLEVMNLEVNKPKYPFLNLDERNTGMYYPPFCIFLEFFNHPVQKSVNTNTVTCCTQYEH
jgi:hypothetical protein